MYLPKTLRLDDSDLRVFPKAAEPGEWAVSGAFVFADRDPDDLSRKDRQALAYGFLGTGSFGWSTFVTVAEITPGAYDQVVERLALHFVEAYGAPDVEAARPVAKAEVDFAAGLCSHRVNTLLSVQREVSAEGLRERFAAVKPNPDAGHARIWEIVEEEPVQDDKRAGS